jgi:threonylcarbamoyladenosine tRNA methylthiotransferase MtaB
MKFVVHTFGCKVNTYDTGLVQKNLERSGLVLDASEPQVHVLNTCAVTAEATKEAVRMIRKIKAKSPFSTVVVTGCAAQVDTGSFENLPGADLVVANSHKGLLPFLIDQHFKGELKERVFKSNIFRKDDLEAGGGLEESHTRAFLKIQDGCNSFCSFCIIPYARGKSRSIPIDDLVRRVNELHAQGFEEVVLTGVHIGDYEDPDRDSKNKLEDLVESVLLRTKVNRFRLTSLEPIELSERLLDLYSDSRLCPHFHMSIQSANTEVLREMKRKYGQKEVRESLEAIARRVPGAFVGMDVIAGFPTETEEQFEDTYKALAETPWTRLHVFPYSERKGTRAATLPQLHLHVRKERAARLRELSLHRYQSEALKQVGTQKLSLLLRDSNRPQAVSRDYWTILLDGEWPVVNGEVLIKVTSVELQQSPRMEGALRGVYVGA